MGAGPGEDTQKESPQERNLHYKVVRLLNYPCPPEIMAFAQFGSPNADGRRLKWQYDS